MRRLIAAFALSATLFVPAVASAHEVPPLPPAVYCVAYHATTICMFMSATQTVYVIDSPYFHGITYGPPVAAP